MAAGTLIPINTPTVGALITPVAADGTNGHRLANDDGGAMVVIDNPELVPLTITVTVPAEADTEFAGGLTIADLVKTTSAVKYVMPRLNPKMHRQRSGDNINYMHITLAAGSGDLDEVKIHAIRA